MRPIAWRRGRRRLQPSYRKQLAIEEGPPERRRLAPQVVDHRTADPGASGIRTERRDPLQQPVIPVSQHLVLELLLLALQHDAPRRPFGRDQRADGRIESRSISAWRAREFVRHSGRRNVLVRVSLGALQLARCRVPVGIGELVGSSLGAPAQTVMIEGLDLLLGRIERGDHRRGMLEPHGPGP